MSFSGKVKEELFRRMGASRHCQLAELAALVCFNGRAGRKQGQAVFRLDTENPDITRKYFTLLNKTISINNGGKELQDGEAEALFLTLKLQKKIPQDGEIRPDVADGLLLQQTCCKRAYIRGAFLSAGSMSDPDKSYHFEIVCRSRPQAEQLQGAMKVFVPDAKIVQRKKHFVVYLKEGAQIVDMLNVMEAHVAMMDLENVRILKDMRNAVNRKVNCETANISKTVNAAVRQIEDIQRIVRCRGMEFLPENLRETAALRLEYPDASLQELGAMLNPPVGKSGVNHRLRRISRIADSL